MLTFRPFSTENRVLTRKIEVFSIDSVYFQSLSYDFRKKSFFFERNWKSDKIISTSRTFLISLKILNSSQMFEMLIFSSKQPFFPRSISKTIFIVELRFSICEMLVEMNLGMFFNCISSTIRWHIVNVKLTDISLLFIEQRIIAIPTVAQCVVVKCLKFSRINSRNIFRVSSLAPPSRYQIIVGRRNSKQIDTEMHSAAK